MWVGGGFVIFGDLWDLECDMFWGILFKDDCEDGGCVDGLGEGIVCIGIMFDWGEGGVGGSFFIWCKFEGFVGVGLVGLGGFGVKEFFVLFFFLFLI